MRDKSPAKCKAWGDHLGNPPWSFFLCTVGNVGMIFSSLPPLARQGNKCLRLFVDVLVLNLSMVN